MPFHRYEKSSQKCCANFVQFSSTVSSAREWSTWLWCVLSRWLQAPCSLWQPISFVYIVYLSSFEVKFNIGLIALNGQSILRCSVGGKCSLPVFAGQVTVRKVKCRFHLVVPDRGYFLLMLAILIEVDILRSALNSSSQCNHGYIPPPCPLYPLHTSGHTLLCPAWCEALVFQFSSSVLISHSED